VGVRHYQVSDGWAALIPCKVVNAGRPGNNHLYGTFDKNFAKAERNLLRACTEYAIKMNQSMGKETL